jgi:4-hydroxyacetophenone monooxygenase
MRMPKRFDPAGKAITADDASIARALEDVSIPTLLLSMVHMSGDTRILDGPLRPIAIILNEVQGVMSEQDKAAVREKALEVIREFRDGGCQLPPPPDEETLHRMMEFLVAGEVPKAYVPMMLEEMELDGRDPRALEWSPETSDAQRADFPVLVIGCGMAGLLTAIRLEEAGIPYTVFEKNPGVGGTWYENSYPGCRVDVGNHFYCYSFEPNPGWTEFFAQQKELQAYFEGCLEKYGVRAQIRFETEVVAAEYDESEKRWSIRVRNPDGSEEVHHARAVISAVGQLNRPKLPDIPGIDSFQGPSFHSSRWNHDVDLSGKRVAVVGSGASAFQIVPTIAPQAERVSVFQRSAPWMFPNPNYHAKVGEGKKWALEHLPYYARWYRFLLFWPGCDIGHEAMRRDPEWPQDVSTCSMNEAARITFSRYITEQVEDDRELLAKVIPDYVCLGKRTLQDNGSWLAALKRDDVDLVADAVAEVREHSLVTEAGEEIEVDVIVWATGFHANRFLWPMDIIGRDGVKLREHWGDVPEAYLGITIPHFPNLFVVYGPGTNLAHGGSLIFHAECQVKYILHCLKGLIEGGHDTLECRQDVHDDYNRRHQQAMQGMVWTHPSIGNSWYTNDEGRVTVLSPWKLVDYWAWTRQPDFADFRVG